MAASDSRSDFKVFIIGGGLAGALLTNGLMRDNVNVQVFERYEAAVVREGYQIRLGASALVGFRACLRPERLAELIPKFGRSGGSRAGAPIIFDKNFKPLLDLTVFPAYTKSAPISRNILREFLVEEPAAAGLIHYGRAFTKYEIVNPGTDSERVRVHFSDGTTDECDLLIGADGSNSKINVQLGLNNIHSPKAEWNALSKAELPTHMYEKLPPRMLGNPCSTFANGHGMFFATYMPESDDSSSGNLKYNDSLSALMLGTRVPKHLVPEGLENKSKKEIWDFIKWAYRDWSPEHHAIIDVASGSDIYVVRPRISTRPALNWRRKVASSTEPERGHPRVWLMGDAIHAMLPSRGMGGNQAMRDTAVVLPLVLDLYKKAVGGNKVTTADIAASLAQYEKEMIPRAFYWVEVSGGPNDTPDSATFTGRVRLYMMGVRFRVASWWQMLSGLFWTREVVDDAPELK